MFYENAIAESKRIDAKIKTLQSEISSLPDGKFICTQNGVRTKWYVRDQKGTNYIPKREKKFARQMADKKFKNLQLKHLLHEQTAIQFYLRHHDQDAVEKEMSFINSPKYHDLLTEKSHIKSKNIQEWLQEPYERNELYPEALIHRACSGIYVRSKSEMLIDMVLYRRNIPFRYECLLELEDGLIYPDFTIKHPITGELFYWEHFGMMDNETYCDHAIAKLRRYTANGIFPSIQLITTYETKQHPLNVDLIESLVDYYFG